MARALIISGPNGSGKSTFARAHVLAHMKIPFLNGDDIARQLSPYDPYSARIAAARQVIRAADAFAARGESFAIETTLAGARYPRSIARWRSFGAHVTLFFVWMPDAALCLARINDRVRKGGHDVPEKDVRRRFAAGLKNLPGCCREADWCFVFDNSGPTPSLIHATRRSDENPV